MSSSSSAGQKEQKVVTLQEEFQLFSTIGCGSILKLAVSEPFRTMKLQPFFTIAYKKPHRQPNPLSDAIGLISNGFLYCNGNFVENSGIPFLLEGRLRF